MQYELSYYIDKYRKPAIIATIVLFIVLAATITYYTLQLAEQRRGKIAVPVQVVPHDANVKLSTGETLPSNGTAYIAPGEYKVTVSYDGFTSQRRDLRVSSTAKPFIYTGLVGKTKEAKQWQVDNQADYGELETLTVERAREYNTLFKSNNPIVNVLPIKDPYYTIDYRNYDDKSIELIIYGVSPKYRQVALNFLRSKGYEPTDYRISYDNFDNPLEKN